MTQARNIDFTHFTIYFCTFCAFLWLFLIARLTSAGLLFRPVR